MISSTASSAASALESEPAATGCFLGMDEAGYGPNLGPLLITVTRWTTPGHPFDCQFYKELRRAVCATGNQNGKRLHLADSKLVNVGRQGFAALELGALSLLSCAGLPHHTFLDVWHALVPGTVRDACPLPEWYGADVPLPLEVGTQPLQDHTGRLLEELARSRISLDGIAVDLVTEQRFNRLATEYGSKGLLLSRLTLSLLRQLWNHNENRHCGIVGDKHGGRNRYDELLAEVLDGELVFRVEESRHISRYRVQKSELRFQVQGERHLPVAAASIISKYLREVCMRLFNQFWSQHVPDLKPTLGYPLDARRFHTDITPARLRLNVDETRLWRER